MTLVELDFDSGTERLNDHDWDLLIPKEPIPLAVCVPIAPECPPTRPPSSPCIYV